MARTHSEDFFHCNNCGEEVPINAKVCPHCGADDETAWKDGHNQYVMPEDDFEYEEVLAREVPDHAPRRSNGKWWVALVAALLLALMILRMLW